MKTILSALKLYVNDFCIMFCGELGFADPIDLIKSLFNIKLILFSANIIIILSSFTKMISDCLGLKPQILMGFAAFIILEFFTGVAASLQEGKKVENKKVLRVFVKLTIYGFLLFALNAMTSIETFTVWGLKISLWDYIFWICFCGINFKLLISILENLDRMGFKETTLIHKFLNGKLALFIDFDKKKTEQLMGIKNKETKANTDTEIKMGHTDKGIVVIEEPSKEKDNKEEN